MCGFLWLLMSDFVVWEGVQVERSRQGGYGSEFWIGASIYRAALTDVPASAVDVGRGGSRSHTVQGGRMVQRQQCLRVCSSVLVQSPAVTAAGSTTAITLAHSTLRITFTDKMRMSCAPRARSGQASPPH
jgi:hypothetical protein